MKVNIFLELFSIFVLGKFKFQFKIENSILFMAWLALLDIGGKGFENETSNTSEKSYLYCILDHICDENPFSISKWEKNLPPRKWMKTVWMYVYKHT